MSTDQDYFLSCAEEEEAKAAASENDFARDAHLRLAETYRNAARNCGPRPFGDRQLGSSELYIL
jgi:hypothetical protein